MIKDFEDNGIKLMFGDCLERMKEIPDGSIDLVLTDHPCNRVTKIYIAIQLG